MNLRRFAARQTVLGCTMLMLAGCATILPPSEGSPSESVWRLRQQRLSQISNWLLQGRVGIETATESGSAALRWEQKGEQYSMRIMAPLSQGTFELTGSDEGVRLRSPDNQILSARDPEALMSRQLGWSLPVSGLRYWVLGIPSPLRPIEHIRVDENGRMLDLQQDGWRISIQRYGTVAGEELPDKIFMENSPLKVRMVIGEWQLR